mmetsp:Transcript_8174/g.20108  ORF Transcript_8174/g.20108 Transcript_8174/m.20108 type:complete len:129 (+) Transcript_8174:741-1127(+)
MNIAQIDRTMKRKIVRIKRTGRVFRKKGKLVTQASTTTIVACTVSFDDNKENDYANDQSSGGDSCHLVRLVWMEKRRAVQDTDSARLCGTPRKRAKFNAEETIHGRDDKTDSMKSSFQPDFDLIISWL